MSLILNDTQRKLVEDNHNLIYSFLNNHHLSLDDIDDWYGTVAIGLCNAALTYDEGRGGKFTTYVYKCMNNAVLGVLRKKYKSITQVFSLDDSAIDGGRYEDIIADQEDCFFEIYVKDAIEIATKGMSDRDVKIVDMIVRQGYDQATIAKMLGVSRQRVSYIIKPAIEKIREYFSD